MKKLLVKFVVVSFLVAGFSTNSFAAKCTGITMSDMKGVAGGKYPQQYELSEYEKAAGCKILAACVAHCSVETPIQQCSP